MAPSNFPPDICGSSRIHGPLSWRIPLRWSLNFCKKVIDTGIREDSALGLEASWVQMLTRPCFLSLGVPALPPWSSVPLGWQRTCLWTRQWQTPFDDERPQSQGADSCYSSSCTAVATGSCLGVKNWGQGFSLSKERRPFKYKWTTFGSLNLLSSSCPDLTSTL